MVFRLPSGRVSVIRISATPFFTSQTAWPAETSKKQFLINMSQARINQAYLLTGRAHIEKASRVVGLVTAIFVALLLTLILPPGPASAAPLNWSETGPISSSPIWSLAWDGTDTLYAGCNNGHVYSRSG
ncbi:MAG: hypothetical protein P9M08_05970, partial [Candidatus Erginobacter occultus]|nr:hypothetical protein [Candidatus Erginobacter occultus]